MTATFHALLLLHYVRTQVSAWLGCMYTGNPVGNQSGELIWSLQRLGMAARCGGLVAYAQMCQDCCACLVPPGDSGPDPGETLRLMGEWLICSDHYLRDPTNAGAVANLVVRFTALAGEDTDNLIVQGKLFRALLLTA